MNRFDIRGTCQLLRSRFIFITSFSLVLFSTLLVLVIKASPVSDIGSAVEEDSLVYLLVDSHTAVVNGEKLSISSNPSITPIVESGRTLVPLRFVSEQLGITVLWDQGPRGITLQYKDKRLKLSIDQHVIEVDGEKIRIDVAPRIVHGSTYVPLRAIMEALDMHLYTNKGVISISPNGPKPMAVELAFMMEMLAEGLPFAVYQNEVYIDSFSSRIEAERHALLRAFSSVRDRNGNWLWDNYPPYGVITASGEQVGYFQHYADAMVKARKVAGGKVIFRHGDTLWESGLKSHRIRGVPLIGQFPELDRGCEVTSLAMLLNFHGIKANKMTLAEEITTLPFQTLGSDGVSYRANPYYGFIGDIYTFNKPGLGVYHGPIAKLAETYAPNQVADLTGATFDDVLAQVSLGRPVWAIVTSTYNVVPESEWATWNTKQGKLKVTYKEHSVVITGFDEQYVYMNDPFKISAKVDKANFQKGWEQIGSQAIVLANQASYYR